jgi:hypothetical protein
LTVDTIPATFNPGPLGACPGSEVAHENGTEGRRHRAVPVELVALREVVMSSPLLPTPQLATIT